MMVRSLPYWDPAVVANPPCLSIIAGLVTPDKGEIRWDGISLSETPPHLRKFGLMFQDYALFPHMNVYANIAFGLKMAHNNPGEIDQRVEEMLHLVGLPDFSKRDVNTLSGGEQQRVALARALAPHPRLLMLDEPLGSLDRNMRERLVIDLKRILHQMHQMAIYVTHDQEEAFSIADRIIVINAGRVEQVGSPIDIYSDPATIFVARFLEMTNIIPAEIKNEAGARHAITPLGNFPLETNREGRINLLIRPDLARLDATNPIVLRGIFKEVTFRGSNQRVTLLVNQIPLIFEFNSQVLLPDPGAELMVSFDPHLALKAFPIQ